MCREDVHILATNSRRKASLAPNKLVLIHVKTELMRL